MREPCDNCGSTNVKETPTEVKMDDGTVEQHYDTLEAVCMDCKKEWIIAYY